MKTKNPFTLNLSVYAITVIISFFVMMKPLTANAEKLDFNGDGKSDVFWRNSLTGETSAWLIDGGQVIQYTQYGTVLESGWYPRGLGDFNGDGNTDVFWYNYDTGATSAWLIDGGQVIQYTQYGTVPDSSGWYIVGFGDFNGDGNTDVFWYNLYTGATSAWLIDGGQVIQYTEYEAVSDDWSIKGFGDFNGDGNTDVFWHNLSNGETSAWLMDGGQVIQYTQYGTVEPFVGFSGWQIIGFGDFNGDGKTDIFWRNYDTGATSAWLIDGESVQYTEYATVSQSSGWRIAGFGDFNGDGNTDVFWHNLSNGETSAWLFDRGQVIQYTQYGTLRWSSGWRIADFGDFNGDGKTDVFWRNDSNGKNVAWLIDEGQVIQFLNYSTVPSSSGWYPVSFFVYYQ
jgi:hypothetical protein